MRCLSFALVLCSLPVLAGPVEKMYGLFGQLRSGAPVSFQLTDVEINDYLKQSLVMTPRPGLKSVTFKIFPKNYISTFAVVDFDAIERWKPGTIPVLLRPVLSGTRSVWVDARFKAEGGLASFSIEKAYFQKIPLPAFVVEKMIQVVAARQPEHYDTSKPVPIPFGLKRVWTEGNTIRGVK